VKRLKASKAQDEALERIFESFNEYQNPGNVCSSFGSMLQALSLGEASSISLSVYRAELQVTFWKKNANGKSEVIASFGFVSPEGFIAGVEELS